MPKKTAPKKTAPSDSDDFDEPVPKSLIDAVTEVDLKGYKYGAEPRGKAPAASLDLLFMLDCTGSMGSTINACQKDIINLTTTLRDRDNIDVRFGLIAYRDHHDNEKFCTKVYPFTRDQKQMQKNVNDQYADGGGDVQEAVTAALFEAVCVEWRPEAAKQVVIMADAGPHGLGHGDSLPNGDPDGKDPLSIAREMMSLGITIYSIITASWSLNDKTKWFFSSMASMTGGKCMSGADSNLLKDLVIEGATDAVSNENNVRKIQVALDALREKKGRELSKTEETKETDRILRLVGYYSALRPTGKSKGKKKGKSKAVTAASSTAFIVPPDDRLEQARSAQSIKELDTLWSSVSSMATSSAAPASGTDATTRITSMREARDARSTDKVIVECIAEGKKIRARVVSPGYDPKKNVQFPSKIRAVGKRFVVDLVVDAGSFYRAKGCHM